MIKIWRYIVIPAAAFVVGLIIFSRVLNQGMVDLTTEMSDATLPVVYMVEDGERVNELHGYTEEMDAATMRDTITPMEIGGVLQISMDTYGNEIDTVSYEVRSLDAAHLFQQSEADNLVFGEDETTADLTIQNILARQTEYLLIIQVESSADTWYYYTRIVEDDSSYIDESISFVRNFHEITLNKNRQRELTDYMETTPEVSNDSLQTVTLKNSLSQVCWGDLQGIEMTDPIPQIMEIGENSDIILLDYIFQTTENSGDPEYYTVEEYYRVRKGEDRMYLLDFERTVEEIFRGQDKELPSEELSLGIRSSDVDFMTNETGTEVCFVQSGELWGYNSGSDDLTKIFSFRSLDEMDIRENYNEHEIRILSTNETGSVDFVVYGYMNRGDHEGQVGISICHFDSATTTVEEQVFIPFQCSYQMLRSKIGQEMYITDTGLFYLTLDDQVFCVDLDSRTYSVEISGMTEGNYASSEDGRYLAWAQGDAQAQTTLHLTDLETGRSSDIEAPDGYLIRPLGFMDSDCVYGLAAKQAVLDDPSSFLMSRVYVVDFSDPDLPVLKSYESTDAYVTGAEIHDGNIYLEREKYQEGSYVEAEEDVIYNLDMQNESLVMVNETYSEMKETQIALQLPQEITEEPELAETKLIRANDTTLSLADEVGNKTYYVYAKGRILLGTDRLVDAITCAYENTGAVIGEDQNYVWNFMRSSTGEAEYPIPDGQDSDGRTLDLTGLTLDEVLYYVGEGLPVFAVLDGSNVVITGYDSYNVTIYDPALDETTKQGRMDAQEMFEASANRFTVTLAG